MYWINLIGSTIVSMITIYVVNCNISNSDIKSILNKKNLIIYLLLNFVFFFNIMFLEEINKVLLNLFIIIILNLTAIFNFNYKKSIYYALLFFIIGLLVEVFISVFSVLIFNYGVESYQNSQLAMFLFSVCSSVISIFVSKIRILSKSFEKFYNKYIIKSFNMIFLIFITIYSVLLSFNNFKTWENNIRYYLNFATIIFIILTSIVLLYTIVKKSKIEDKYNQMLEYVTKYESIINEQGKRNHEFNNQLMVLQGYINNKKKLKEYLGILINDQKGGQNFRIKQLGYLPDGGLKGLIYYKLSKMEENEIKPFLYVSENLKDSFNDMNAEFYSDITKIFGVFIDNAIDAAREAEKKEIVIDIRRDDDSLIINISNTYKESSDINKIGKKGYTSKGIGHGFGLSIVSDITKKNDRIESFNDIENNMFKQTLIIYLK